MASFTRNPLQTHHSNIPPRQMENSQGSKRPVETIDLSNSDDESSYPVLKKVQLSSQGSGYQSQPFTQGSLYRSQPSTQGSVYQSQPSSSVRGSSAYPIDLDEEEANELVPSQDSDFPEALQKYGALPTKAVGVRFYTGIASNGEYVVCRREPHNVYDPHAIQILNVSGAQIGHIPRTVAGKLAKYMDEGSIVVDAVLTGPKGEYDAPIELGLWGPSDPTRRAALKDRLKNDRLPYNLITAMEKEEKERKKMELARAAKQPSGVPGSSNEWWESGFQSFDFVGSSSQGFLDDAISFNDLIAGSQMVNPREVGEYAEKFGTTEEDLAKLPSAEKPDRITTEMLPYQLQGLAWLLEKENPQLPPHGSTDVVQLWKRAANSSQNFKNIATNYTSREEPRLASGGILADDMGLGKTLQIISLIVADMETMKSVKGTQSKSTLIVAPLGVMSNWSDQIAFHVDSENPLSVLIYHGTNKKKMNARDFANYDVVITTYGALSNEYNPGKQKENKPAPIPRPSGLYSVEWRRVVLDEGHIIRNPSTKASLAAAAILARSKWALTGTPIINTLMDLGSLLRFVGVTGGLEQPSIFKNVVERPMKHGDSTAIILLQAIMAQFTLRRKKDFKFVDLKLPSLSEYVHNVKFRKTERERYDALADEARGRLDQFIKRSRKGQRAQAAEAYRHLLEVLLRLRQVCNHWKLCPDRINKLMENLEKNAVVELTPENCKALQEVLQLHMETSEDCPICMETLSWNNSPVVTHCGHPFCRECIARVIQTQGKCPMCREQLDESKLVEPAQLDKEEEMEDDIDTENSSSKVHALLQILEATHKEANGGKVVIFSQWAKFLTLVEPHILGASHKFVRLDGTMKAPDRDEALKTFAEDDDTTILLATLGVCSVGLNLVAANTVVLCDSWWAPAIEDQAVDRIHRLGQTRDCTVFRLVVEETVEQRVLDIQAEKRKLMSTAFKEKENKRDRRGARLGDIQRLLA